MFSRNLQSINLENQDWPRVIFTQLGCNNVLNPIIPNFTRIHWYRPTILKVYGIGFPTSSFVNKSWYTKLNCWLQYFDLVKPLLSLLLLSLLGLPQWPQWVHHFCPSSSRHPPAIRGVFRTPLTPLSAPTVGRGELSGLAKAFFWLNLG